MQRNLADARRTYDNLAGLSPVQQKACEAEITAATKNAEVVAERMTEGRVNDVSAVRDEALADLCAVRDDFAALQKQATLGRLAARDYETGLRSIQARQRRAERHLADVEDAITFVAAVEEDRLSYIESLYDKFPNIRPDFSF